MCVHQDLPVHLDDQVEKDRKGDEDHQEEEVNEDPKDLWECQEEAASKALWVLVV
jgi:hypothetical protein